MSDATRDAGPYHAGERAVQIRAGVRASAERVGRAIRSSLPAAMAEVLPDFGLVVAASLDETGQPWASLLIGHPGFLRAIDDRLVLVAAVPTTSDPLARNLALRPELGLLPIDLPTRRRLRLNGRALLDEGRGIFLQVEQAYGNCPRFIHPRAVQASSPPGAPGSARSTAVLDARQRALIAGADTFFIASAHPRSGADASHRGGPAGFVRVVDDSTLVFPDYPGNDMFNTLGNLVVEPRAGLLVPDFVGGGVLQVAGRGCLDWSPAAATQAGRGRVVVFEITEVRESRGLGLRVLPSQQAGPGISRGGAAE